MKLYEKAPPGAKAEHWVKSNKERFKKRYGEKAGERVLYAKAWKLFGEEVVDEGYTVKKTHIEKASKDDDYGSDADVHHYDVIHNKSGKKVGTVQKGLFGTTLKTSKSSYDLGGGGDVQAKINKSSRAKKMLGEEVIDEGKWDMDPDDSSRPKKNMSKVPNNPYAEKMERHSKWRAIKDANQKKAKERESAKKDIERAKEMNEGMARWSKENGFEIAYDKHPESKKFAQAYHSGEIKDYEDHGNGWYTHKKTGTAFEVRRHRGQHPRVKDVGIYHRGSETPPMNEDAAPTNVMGASAADPNSPPIQGFSPMLHKKALKRKVKDVKLDRILALIRRGLK